MAGLLADAVTFLISAVCLQRMRVVEPDHTPGAERAPLRRQIVEGLRFVGRDPYLRPMVTWGAAINMALMGYQAVQVVFLVRTVGLNPATVGLLLTSGSAGGIAGALLANGFSRRFGTARGLLLLQAATAPFALLMPLTTAGRSYCCSRQAASSSESASPWPTSWSAASGRPTAHRTCSVGSWRRP